MAISSSRRYLVNREAQQYVDHIQAYEYFARQENEEEYEKLVEQFDEFVSDQWSFDEVGQTRELKGKEKNYENVTEHWVKRRFGTLDFSGELF